jgi:hypothetical protein
VRRVGPTDHETLGRELQGLGRLSRHSLAERWSALYGAPPPPRTSRSLMIRAVAYKMQERAFGGLTSSTRRLLAGDAPSARSNVPSREARPGTVLLREWQGVTHQVTVIENGVLYRGERHRSLSAVARVITGSRWSGPLFFGLKANHDQGYVPHPSMRHLHP